jgi:hypothetical protein
MELATSNLCRRLKTLRTTTAPADHVEGPLRNRIIGEASQCLQESGRRSSNCQVVVEAVQEQLALAIGHGQEALQPGAHYLVVACDLD